MCEGYLAGEVGWHWPPGWRILSLVDGGRKMIRLELNFKTEVATAFVDQTSTVVWTRGSEGLNLNLGGNREEGGEGHARDLFETLDLAFLPRGKRLTPEPYSLCHESVIVPGSPWRARKCLWGRLFLQRHWLPGEPEACTIRQGGPSAGLTVHCFSHVCELGSSRGREGNGEQRA